MRKPIAFIAVVGIAALALAQGGTSNLLSSFGKAMNDAKTVSSNYTAQTIHAGGAEDYSITLKKPNMARIETPTQVFIADGKDLTTFDKSAKTYFKQPETPALMKATFAPEELHLFAGFFDPNAYATTHAKDLGSKTVKGGSLSVVEATYNSGNKVVTYLLDPQDKVARKAQVVLDIKDDSKKVSMILDTKSLTLNADVPNSTFVFDPPADSREMTLAEINSAKWYYDLDEAKKVAQASGRKIFVDFYATWCGPCKMLERDCFGTEQFKKFGKKLVFCRIDVDEQESVMNSYGVTAMPTQDILDKDGTKLQERVGYSNADDFFSFLTSSVGTP